MVAQFHLALPCLNINKTIAFYKEGLGAQIGRSAQNWVDINLYDNQITFTKCGPFNFNSKSYSFGGEVLPSFHFGVILKKEQWTMLMEKIKSEKMNMVSQINFLSGKVGEHDSFFLKDPNGYTVEFKCFNNQDEVFKS